MPVALTQTELIAVLVTIIDYMPYVMTIHKGSTLPSGPFELAHHSLQAGLRDWIHQQTRYPVGFLEQLYTFADQDRIDNQPEVRTISISYLGLVRQQNFSLNETEWHGWYEYFPWENRLKLTVKTTREMMIEALYEWQQQHIEDLDSIKRRIDFLFGLNGYAWNEDLILQRYELLYEAGLVPESRNRQGKEKNVAGQDMFADHRRILATAIARLRAQIKYKALVFELMPTEFTLLQLQKTIEQIIGRSLHKSNFRRMIEQQNLIEETGRITDQYRGRPAKLFRYQKSIVDARAMAGSTLPLIRN